jgi:YVTN family beta-propeller protein
LVEITAEQGSDRPVPACGRGQWALPFGSMGTRPGAHRRRPARAAICAILSALAFGALAASASADTQPGEGDTHEAIFVGNNWEGTADVIIPGPHQGYESVAEVNIIPDIQERMTEILLNPVRLGYFLAVQQLIGEGHNQYVDDMYTSPDGRLLIVSRPSLADVVAIRLRTGEIAWRFPVAGQRSDHMGLSPDGTQVAVSASTGNVVHILDVQTGEEVDQFASGDSPHENTYSRDGSRLYHASIGLVYTPLDQPLLDSTKGERVFEVVDTDGYDVIETIDIGEKLAQAGYPDMSSAVRPMALSPNEQKVYLQVSFFHGFVEYSFKRDEVTRVAELPNLVPEMPREQYLLDSAHHGIAMDGRGRALCVAGTMDDYVAMVSRKSFDFKLLKDLGTKPYWSTTSRDGRRCYVSWSGTDSLSVISYRTGREIARIPVGDHPQRVRTGDVRTSWLRAQQG